MDAVHWHLVLTHVPVVGTVFALLLLAVAVVTANQAVRRLGLAAVVVVAALALPAYLTGEPAEEIVERLPGVSEQVIDRHESAATTAFAAVEVLGVLALAGLALSLRARRVPTWVVTGMLLVTALTAGLMGRTANLGGQIRHTEIRTGAAAAPADVELRAAPRRGHDEKAGTQGD